MEDLLNEFGSLPKSIDKTTYLEICKYPTSRFEEICSRILSFYFQPKNEHGLNSLILQSLIELIPQMAEFKLMQKDIKVMTEENAEGKRIDITILSDDFAIGIENKITASLYNPLDVYQNIIKSHHRKISIGIVLSLRRIVDVAEINLMKDHDFINILYSDFFLRIKQNIGFYIDKCDQRYLIHLNDFIKTIENMDQNSRLDQEMINFIVKNYNRINELSKYLSIFNDEVIRIQLVRLKALMDALRVKTSANWWIYQNFDLIGEYTLGNHVIGTESIFTRINDDPFGEFTINITTWKLEAWNSFGTKVKEFFPESQPQADGKIRRILYKKITRADEQTCLRLMLELNEIMNLIVKN